MSATLGRRHVNTIALPADWPTSTDALPGAAILVREVALPVRLGPGARLGMAVVAFAEPGSLTNAEPSVLLSAVDDEHGHHAILLDPPAAEALVREVAVVLGLEVRNVVTVAGGAR